MIKVTTRNGLDLFISLWDDTELKKGGYYCEVYLKEDDCLNIDNFVIHKDDLDCFEDREVGIETFCKVYAKHFDDMPYLNVEFNEIYEKMSDAYDLLNEFYLKHIFSNEKCDPDHRDEMRDLYDKMGEVKELAHNIAEHYTWD
jgi:hypothetical protein